MGIHVKNITHVDVYWQKTLSFNYESVKCSSMDMNKSAVGVYWVSDGVDQCLVGFLHCHQVKHLNKLEGALRQVMEVYSDNSESPTKCHKHKKNFGCAIAAIVSSNEPNKVRKAKNKLQSPPKTPTNVEKQKRSIGSATEESRHTKNRKLSV